MKEKEINLVDLFIEILLHWRSMVLFMLIGGMVMGAITYAKSAQRSHNQNNRTEQSLEDITESKGNAELTDKQLNNVNYVLYYEEQYNNKMDYQQESILMQIDPNNVSVAEASFLIMSDDLEQTYHYEKAYEDFAHSVELQEKLAKQAGGVLTSYINEIYSVTNSATGKQNGSVTFKVEILHYDEEVCKSLLDTVMQYIESKHEEIEKIWGVHEIVVLNQSVGKVSSQNIQNLQNNVVLDIRYLQSCAANIKETFTDEEWHYYNLLSNVKLQGNLNDNRNEEDIITEAGVITAPKVNVKYVLAVVILVALIYSFIIFLLYWLNNKIRATDQFDELYAIPHLGQIPNEHIGKKLFGFVDDWLLTLRCPNRHKLSRDEALILTAATVKMVSKKEKEASLYFIGCGLNEDVRKDCQKIIDILAEEGVSVCIIDNLFYDVCAREKLESVKSVVLVEKAGSSLYAEIAQELALLKIQEVKVLGGIIIE